MSIPIELITRNVKRRGLLLGSSSLIMSLSIFFFAFPHFVIPSIGEDIQDHLTNISLFCKVDIEPSKPLVTDVSDMGWFMIIRVLNFWNKFTQFKEWKYFFTALTFICGASLLPIWTTGYAVIEKETDIKSGTRNMAFVNIFGSMFGPIAGLVIGSVSISYWEQPGLTTEINLTPEERVTKLETRDKAHLKS